MALLLVDGSYYCFNRYHAVKRWWSFRASSEPPGILPSQSPVFVDKFVTTFIPSLLAYRKKHSTASAMIWVAKDGSHIWRYSLASDYKAGRDSSKHPDIGFFLDLAYSTLFTDQQIGSILFHDKLEADDCIALVVRQLRELQSPTNVTILTSDHDYLQLADDRTKIINMEDCDITKSKKSTGDPNADLFCKIICGDKSDNISQVFPRVGHKTACKLYNDPARLKGLFEKHAGSSEKFEHNKTMIDFTNIPKELVAEFYSSAELLQSNDQRSHVADASQYLRVMRKDGSVEHLPGPCLLWEDPTTHEAIHVEGANMVNSDEAIVVHLS